MNLATSLSRYLFVCAFGFGLGGLFWGWVLYQGIPQIEFPFHFMAIVIMGLFGGISLSLFSRSIRDISKTVLAGFLGYGVGFFVTAVFSYYLFLYGGLFLISLPFKVETLREFVNLKPNIEIGGLWLVFLFSGAIVGIFYALFLKLKIWSLIWRTGLGFALGSLIGPIIGNLIGNLFDSLLISYLVSFSLIGIFLGLFLGWGIYRGQINP